MTNDRTPPDPGDERTLSISDAGADEEATLGLAGYQNYLGRVLGHMGRYTEAEPFLIASYDAHIAAHGADSEITAGAAQGLVELYEAWGRPDEAARYRPE